MTLLAALTLAALAAGASPPEPAQEGSAPNEPGGTADTDTPRGPRVELLDHAALSARLTALAGQHRHVELEEIGRSRGGRAIHAVRLARGDVDAPGRPALLVVANVDGPQVFSSGVALQLVEALAEGTAEGGDELLETTTVHVIPRANPDAAEARFLQPRREVEATGADVDNDRDGRVGEDGPADVDGDGLVLRMRVPDPEGTWTTDPTDDRVLVPADPTRGQRGRWKVFPEGRDADGDEAAAEDPAADAVVNRNFPAGWREHDASAGVFPGDEPEALALLEYVLGHPELGAVVTYGELDSLVEPPQAAKSEGGREVPYPEVMKDDAGWYAELGRRYRAIVDGGAKGRGEHAGTFQRWLYQERGLLALNVVPWDVPLDAKPAKADGAPGGEGADADGDDAAAGESAGADEPAGGRAAAGDDPGSGDQPQDAEVETGGDAEAPAAGDRGAGGDAAKGRRGAKGDEPKPSDDAQRLAWIDAQGADEIWRFVPWKPFEHPELGVVEIGGFAPFARTEPPPGEQDALADRQIAFVVALGGLLPRVALSECTARELGPDLYEVEAAVTNEGLLPLSTAAGRRTRAGRPARLRLILSEGDLRLAGPSQVLVEELEGSGGRHAERWLVRTTAPDALTVELDTDGAGHHTANPEVRR